MKNIKTLLLIPVLITAVSHFITAQQSHINLDWAPQKNTQNLKPFGASVISPEVADDGMVTFRVAAPEAREISLSGNVLLGLGVSKPVPFTKGEDGIWTLKVGPIEPEIYYYKLIIDGVSVDDPSNNLTGFAGQPGFSILVVHGKGPAFYDAGMFLRYSCEAHLSFKYSEENVKCTSIYLRVTVVTLNIRYCICWEARESLLLRGVFSGG